MMLTHTPAHTSSHPDRFVNEETGWGYSVLQDTAPEGPSTWYLTEDVALWAYREPPLGRSIAASKPVGNLAVDAFARFYEYFDAEQALSATRRYLAVFHPEEKIDVQISTVTGYSQGDWLEMVVAVREGHGSCQAHLETFRRWAFGDVWVVIPDGRPGICGIYADDAEDALAHFREHFEDSAETLDPDTEGLVDSDELDPLAVSAEPFRVSWEIDSDQHVSPAQAALTAWQQNFNRGLAQPAADDACVFVVSQGERRVQIDLSDDQYAHLFES